MTDVDPEDGAISAPTAEPTGSTLLGYPRQGAGRELKAATEAYWAGTIDADSLLETAATLRLQRLREVSGAGIDVVTSNDFSLYDHVLDTCVMLGAVPARHVAAVPDVSTAAGRLDRYFAMARGTDTVSPLEMTKWFDTNYHYLVPELSDDTELALDPRKPLDELLEASRTGAVTRPVILGPITFLLLAKPAPDASPGFSPLMLLPRVVPLYAQLLRDLHAAGARWVQLDEPCLVSEQPFEVLAAVERTYEQLVATRARPRMLVASYFDRLGEALPVLRATGVDGLAMDFTGPAAVNLADLEAIGGLGPMRLVAGVVDGRNVWASDLSETLGTLRRLQGLVAAVDVCCSCSLLHVPLDVDLELGIAAEVRGWLSFARQKVREVVTLARGLTLGDEAIGAELRSDAARRASRAGSAIVRRAGVRERVAAVRDADLRRDRPYLERHPVQQQRLKLPELPTTTIGSFPQTAALRAARAGLRRGELTSAQYEQAMRTEVAAVVAEQERLGLDVLVHGEPERNDMVQYFAEQLTGFVTTDHGWVQSYGTRYVRPPIIVGDVSRPEPMTVAWARYAQSLTDKPMKGMLTGPVTMLAWSFVRDDQPLADTARQVALALRDEVQDLQDAGLAIVQVDEPALRESLPLRRDARADYLAWAVDSFRLTTSGVRDETQIHTHMCYAEFGDVLQALIDMDADVISLEAARSKMAIVADLARADYPNEVGPGVWDIHSPRVPSVDEIAGQLRAALEVFPRRRLWVNPDCGLKTRAYPEVRASLANLVAAAAEVRAD